MNWIKAVPNNPGRKPILTIHFETIYGWCVYSVLFLLISGRFFTENVAILPRFINASDLFLVPLLGVLFANRLLRQRELAKARGFLWAILLFILAWAVAWVVNFNVVNWIGGLLFAVGLLMPILFYLILIGVNFRAGFIDESIRLLNFLLWVNLVICAVETIQNIGTREFIHGTFGNNSNQLAFFLASMMSFYIAKLCYRKISLVEIVALALSATFFLLATFQTLWVVFAIALVIVFVFFNPLSKRVFSLVAIGILILPLLLGVLNLTQYFGVNEMFHSIVTNFEDLGKVRLVRSLPEIWADNGWSFFVGLGPGTFNSRAFRSIAIIPYNEATGTSDVAAALIKPFYVNPVADKYIISWFTRNINHLSGANTDGPFTSYVSILMEVGFVGAVSIFGIYLLSLLKMLGGLRRVRDPEYRVYAAWGAMNLLMLLGISVVDNYLEATRYTLIAWFSVAVFQIFKNNKSRRSVVSHGIENHSS